MQVGGHSLPAYGFYNEFIMEFFLGIIAFMSFKKIPFYLSLVLIITGCAFFLFSLQKSSSHIVSFGIPSMLILTGLTNLEYRNKIKIPGFFIIIGNASYILYLIHGPLMEKAFFYLDSIHVLGRITILFSIIVIILLSVIIHKYIEKPLLKWLNRNATFKSYPTA
jgi:exopolysaccharide production protein ExoZ